MMQSGEKREETREPGPEALSSKEMNKGERKVNQPTIM